MKVVMELFVGGICVLEVVVEEDLTPLMAYILCDSLNNRSSQTFKVVGDGYRIYEKEVTESLKVVNPLLKCISQCISIKKGEDPPYYMVQVPEKVWEELIKFTNL